MNDLFDPKTLARSKDPETSHISAKMAGGILKGDQAKIMNFPDGIHPMSATYKDIAGGTGLEPVAVNRRLNELKKQGRIVEAGTTLLDSGRPGRTWMAA